MSLFVNLTDKLVGTQFSVNVSHITSVWPSGKNATIWTDIILDGEQVTYDVRESRQEVIRRIQEERAANYAS